MPAQYRTKLYDAIDRIVFDYYGDHENDIVATVIEANPGLELEGFLLTPGLLIVLPDRPAATAPVVPIVRQISLWD